ncbi:hypothetical protein ABK040_016252 [Willaertia magna]
MPKQKTLSSFFNTGGRRLSSNNNATGSASNVSNSSSTKPFGNVNNNNSSSVGSSSSASSSSCKINNCKDHSHHHSHNNIPIYSKDQVDSIQDALIQHELHSPTPDIFILFQHYNKKYFENRLEGVVTLRWSDKMTLCAGICYSKYEKFVKTRKIVNNNNFSQKLFNSSNVHTMSHNNSSCGEEREEITQRTSEIVLSECLLKFRPSIDTINTLIHEMIHAYLFINLNLNEREEHGDNFKYYMNYINKLEYLNGIKITIYHNFHDEVNYYRRFVWKCNKCGLTVKTSINREPNKYDYSFNYNNHSTKCGGKFEKIKDLKDKQTKERKYMEKYFKKDKGGTKTGNNSTAGSSNSNNNCVNSGSSSIGKTVESNNNELIVIDDSSFWNSSNNNANNNQNEKGSKKKLNNHTSIIIIDDLEEKKGNNNSNNFEIIEID